MNQDIFNSLKLDEAIPASAATATENKVGNIIDTQGFEGAMFMFQIGISTANATVTPFLEHGDIASLSDAAGVTDADMIGTELGATLSGAAATSQNKVSKIGYKGIKRYIRLSVQFAAMTGGSFIGASVLLGHPRRDAQSTQIT